MNVRRGLVLDANILMRAVLGRRVRELLERYEDSAAFYSPDVCFEDARYYLSQVLEKRGLNIRPCHSRTDRSACGAGGPEPLQRLPANGLRFAIRTTGRWTYLEAAWRPGRRTGSRYTLKLATGVTRPAHSFRSYERLLVRATGYSHRSHSGSSRFVPGQRGFHP